MLVDSIFI